MNKKLSENIYLNLPDLSFYKKCNDQYRINRGVYNSIDEWFYNYGIINVIHRRMYIVAFLESVLDENMKESGSHTFIRFGHGKLTNRLNEFMENTKEPTTKGKLEK